MARLARDQRGRFSPCLTASVVAKPR